MLFTLLTLLTPGSVDAHTLDPRWVCEHQLEDGSDLIDYSVQKGYLTPSEAEHTAVVEGSLLESRGGGEIKKRRALVTVSPRSQAMVFAMTHNQTLRWQSAAPGRLVLVPTFNGVLRPSASRGWTWAHHVPPRLKVGDVSKADFITRAEPALRELLRTNALQVDNIRLGQISRGSFKGRSLDVLLYLDQNLNGSEEWSWAISVFDANTGELFEGPCDLERRQYILLSNNDRIGRKDGAWQFSLPARWMQNPREVGHNPLVHHFVKRFPSALDHLIFSARPLSNVDFRTSELVLAVNEITKKEYLLLSVRDGSRRSVYYFLFDPQTQLWVNEPDLGPSTFTLSGGRRLGINLPGTLYQNLPPAGQFERLRALFPERNPDEIEWLREAP